MRILTSGNKKELEIIKRRSKGEVENVLDNVKAILENVRNNGDKALFECSKKYDGFGLNKDNIRVSGNEIKVALKKVDKKLISAIRASIANVKKYSQQQMPKEWRKKSNGIEYGQIIRPLDSVGCYIPAGNYPLPSTVIMTVVPAKVAGVKEVIVCTPPSAGDAVIAAAKLAGADKIYRVGGSHAIAAMAYGTQSIPKVNKIVGPGNIYVTAAKKLLYGDVGIDFLAGPSEILIYAEKGNPEYIAADLLAQAEHDRYASAIFVTPSKDLAGSVLSGLKNQLQNLPTKDIASESLGNYGTIILVKNRAEAVSFINDFAPEHLELFEESLLKYISNAGAIFLGEMSCEAAGDYAVGPSHVLPTQQSSKFRAGLSVYDFIKMPSVQKLTKSGLLEIKDTIITLAEAEKLHAHKKSVEIRR